MEWSEWEWVSERVLRCVRACAHLCVCVWFGLSPMQFFIIMKPLSYPWKHSHSKSPGVLTHVPWPHRSGEMRHSSMSARGQESKGDMCVQMVLLVLRQCTLAILNQIHILWYISSRLDYGNTFPICIWILNPFMSKTPAKNAYKKLCYSRINVLVSWGFSEKILRIVNVYQNLNI